MRDIISVSLIPSVSVFAEQLGERVCMDKDEAGRVAICDRTGKARIWAIILEQDDGPVCLVLATDGKNSLSCLVIASQHAS